MVAARKHWVAGRAGVPGHAAGDAVLVADRLAHGVRPGDTVARLGGDEFAVLCEDLPAQGWNGAGELAARIVAAVEQPVRHDGRDLRVSASVGVAIPDRGRDVAEVLAGADRAMYVAKAAGRGRFRFGVDRGLAPDVSDPPEAASTG